MFAVIENGSRQHRVQQGDTLTIDYQADAKKGDTVTFDRVLLANGGGASAIGRPTIEGAVVEAAVVIALDKGPKLEVQKFRRRKDSKRHTGHRQKHTTVTITSINVPGLEVVEPPAEETAAETQQTAPEAVGEETAADDTAESAADE